MKNSTHQNNRLFSALKHAIAAGVLITLSTAGTAQMQPEIGENHDVSQTIDITKPAYPSNQKLFELYQAMVKSGDVAEAPVPPTENDEAFLQRNFDFAIKSGLIDKYTNLLAQPAPPALLAKGSPAQCLAEAAVCTVAGSGATLSCTAQLAAVATAWGAATGGVGAVLSVTALGPACTALFVGTIGACAYELYEVCKGTGPEAPGWDVPQHTTPVAGSEVSKEKEDFCNAGMKLIGLEAFWFNRDNTQKFGKIKANCADGEIMDFGINEGGSGSQKYRSICPAGYMVQGMKVWVNGPGGNVTGARLLCDRVGISGGTDDSSWGAIMGKQTSYVGDLQCPEHSYVYGIKAYRSRDTTSKSVINSIKLHCK